MESIERYSGIFQGDEIRFTRRFSDFAPGEAILPNDVLLFSDAQSRADHSMEEPSEAQVAPESFDPEAKIEWSPVWSLRDGRFKYFRPACCISSTAGPPPSTPIPTAAPPATRSRKPSSRVFSNWSSAMPTRSGGTTNRNGTEVDLDAYDDSYVRDLRSQLADTGRKLWVLDVTSDLGVPTYVAVLHWMQNGQENIEFGSGAHFDKRIALLRTLTELNQFLSIGFMEGGTGEKPSLDGDHAAVPEELSVPDADQESLAADGAGFRPARHHARAGQRLRRDCEARRHGFPGARPDPARCRGARCPRHRSGAAAFLRRFGPGRLYDIPVKLGLRDHPIPESELTPFLPHS